MAGYEQCITYAQGEIIDFYGGVIDNRTILVLPMPRASYLYTRETGDANTVRLCGSLVTLIIEFCIKLMTRLQFTKVASNRGDLFEVLSSEEVDIVLTPMGRMTFLQYQRSLGNFGISLHQFPDISYEDPFAFAAKIYKGKVPLFPYIRWLSPRVWKYLFGSLLILSLISSFDRKLRPNIWKLLNCLYNYSVSLIMKRIEKSVIKTTPKCLLYSWLLSALVLILSFLSHMRLERMRGNVHAPIMTVDSFYELAQMNDMKIVARAPGSFSSPTNMALFRNLVLYDDLAKLELAHCLANGTCAIVSEISSLRLILAGLSKQAHINLLDLVHISAQNINSEPQFFIGNERGQPWVLYGMDWMIKSLRESGNLGEMMKNTKGYDQDQGKYLDHNNYQAITPRVISMVNICGIFYVLLSCVLFSLPSLCIELIFKPAKKVESTRLNEEIEQTTEVNQIDYYPRPSTSVNLRLNSPIPGSRIRALSAPSIRVDQEQFNVEIK